MSQIYNALIRANDDKTGKSKIVGTTLITNKSKLPQSCILTYGNKQADSENLKISEFIQFASPTKPLQLYMDGIPTGVSEELTEKPMELRVVTLTGQVMSITATPTTTIQEVILLLERQYKINSNTARMVLGTGKPLQDNKSLADYKVQSGCTLHLIFRNLGAGSNFTSVDLSSETISGKGVEDGPIWLSFHHGLNLLGTCPNKNCVSNQSGRNGSVIRPEGNGHLILTPENNLVTCTACNEGQFTPKNFIVSGARSLFRFKKVGDGVEVKQRLLECTEESRIRYVMFNPSDSGASYDLIEIRTVGRNNSPFTCVSCGYEIGGKEEERVLEGCAHAYHKACYPEGGNCIAACNVAVAFWSEEDLERECKNQQLLKAQEWQRKFIQKNLTTLTANTTCETALLNTLLEKEAISWTQKQSLETIEDGGKRASELYSIISREVNGFAILISALRKECLSVAANLLENGLKENDQAAWEKFNTK